ncbi:MAG: hypothetical protein V2A76_14115 [Planctomycetota bacterium]
MPVRERFIACKSLLLLVLLATPSLAQELPLSGTNGLELVYASSTAGVSQPYAVAPQYSTSPVPIGPAVNAVPSRWAHRRRIQGALEVQILYVQPGVFMTPMGNAVGNGSIHLIDGRAGLPITSLLFPTGNPAGYDLAVDESLKYVFAVEDAGNGTTTLRGFSFGTVGNLLPLNPPTLTLSGPPAAYVNRIGVEEEADTLHVPTTLGVHVIQLAASSPQMSTVQFASSAPAAPTTNPARFNRAGGVSWVIGTSQFDVAGAPTEAGWLCWDKTGAMESDSFGLVTSNPTKTWVPSVGTEELAVVSNDLDTYVYYLLREPPPGAFYIKPAAVGVVKMLGAAAAVTSIIDCPDDCGEPFATPAVSGTRVAFESSMGPPFINTPPDGAEKINIIYSPLDPLGAGTADGLLAVPGPLGGRIDVRGMDRPIWTHDGTRVVACTSHFSGIANPAVPGIEVLDVPATVAVNAYTSPHVVVQNPTSPYRSIIFPSIFSPRDAAAGSILSGMSFVGNVFRDGMASILTAPFGELGQKQVELFSNPSGVPNFPRILPPTFDDPNGSLISIPSLYGARRTSFNLIPNIGINGLVMSAAIRSEILLQPTGSNHLATIGIGVSAQPIRFALPTGWVTTTEFLSL